MRGEHHPRPARHLLDLLHEHRAAVLQPPHDVRVVHDLAPHVHRGAVAVERPVHDVDRPLDARIVGAQPGTGDFRVVGASDSRDGVILGVGWSVIREDNLAFFVQYDLNWNQDLLGHALALGALIRF